MSGLAAYPHSLVVYLQALSARCRAASAGCRLRAAPRLRFVDPGAGFVGLPGPPARATEVIVSSMRRYPVIAIALEVPRK